MDGDEEWKEKDSRMARAPFVGVALTRGCAFTLFLGILAGTMGKGSAASSEGQDMMSVSRVLEAGLDASMQSPSSETGLVESRFLFPLVLIDSFFVATICSLRFPLLFCRSSGLETLPKAWIPLCWATPIGSATAVVLRLLLGGGIAIASDVGSFVAGTSGRCTSSDYRTCKGRRDASTFQSCPIGNNCFSLPSDVIT